MDKTNRPAVGTSRKSLRRRRGIYSPNKRMSYPPVPAPGVAALTSHRNILKPKYSQIVIYESPEILHLSVNTRLFCTYFLNYTLFKLQFVLTVGLSEDDISMWSMQSLQSVAQLCFSSLWKVTVDISPRHGLYTSIWWLSLLILKLSYKETVPKQQRQLQRNCALVVTPVSLLPFAHEN
jgi:hypothetical protein